MSARTSDRTREWALKSVILMSGLVVSLSFSVVSSILPKMSAELATDERGAYLVKMIRGVDETLVRALRAAHALVRNHEHRDGAPSWTPTNTYERRLSGLALVAPDIQRAILAGRQPADLTLEQLIHRDLPVAWADQRAILGFEPA